MYVYDMNLCRVLDFVYVYESVSCIRLCVRI